MEKVCVVCGVVFNPRGAAKCCSKDCMGKNENNRKAKRRPAEYKKRKEKRKENREIKECKTCLNTFEVNTGGKVFCSADCSKAFHAPLSRIRSARYRLDNPEKVKLAKAKCFKSKQKEYQSRNRQWALENREAIKKYGLKWYYENPECGVKNSLKRQLGFTPPDDLVEEATALRLLRRELR